GESLRILHRLLDQGESPQLLMGGIGWQVRKMLQVRRAMASGIPGPRACTDAGIRWKQTEFARRVSRADLATLQACHDRLLETDLELKTSGSAAEEALLETLVLRLASALAPVR
ncbi:MAG TPA: hypothetical protein VI643_06385, partial [Planctomycetota bacterium]|nr:hypothetical protein [Planctomycetota bacterium]